MIERERQGPELHLNNNRIHQCKFSVGNKFLRTRKEREGETERCFRSASVTMATKPLVNFFFFFYSSCYISLKLYSLCICKISQLCFWVIQVIIQHLTLHTKSSFPLYTHTHTSPYITRKKILSYFFFLFISSCNLYFYIFLFITRRCDSTSR